MACTVEVTSRGLLGAVLLALISVSAALPPDFFRNGLYQHLYKKTVDSRDAHAPGKRSYSEHSLLSDACSFCSSHTGMQQVEHECRTNPNIRHLCLMAYSNELEFLLDNNSRDEIPWE